MRRRPSGGGPRSPPGPRPAAPSTLLTSWAGRIGQGVNQIKVLQTLRGGQGNRQRKAPRGCVLFGGGRGAGGGRDRPPGKRCRGLCPSADTLEGIGLEHCFFLPRKIVCVWPGPYSCSSKSLRAWDTLSPPTNPPSPPGLSRARPGAQCSGTSPAGAGPRPEGAPRTRPLAEDAASSREVGFLPGWITSVSPGCGQHLVHGGRPKHVC